MSWKERVRIGDYPPDTRIEITCKVETCGKFHFVTVGALIKSDYVAQMPLDMFEASRTCHDNRCSGPCRIAIPSRGQTEGFQGGLA